MRAAIGILILLSFTAGLTIAAPPHPRDSSDEPTLRRYVKHTFGTKSAAMAAVGAGVNQLTNTPGEWGQGAAGFGRRFASAFGKHIVHNTIRYPVAKLLHEEVGYHRSNKQGFRGRLKYALVATIITHKTTTERPTLAVGEISGAFGSGLISRLWQPASVRTIGSGFESGGITIAVDAGLNVLREFWPEIRHPHRHSAAQSSSLR